MMFRIIVFWIYVALCGLSSSHSYAQISRYRDNDNSRVEEFARAYRFCMAIIADNPHANPISAIKRDELIGCAIDISLRELGSSSKDDCLRSIGEEWSELLAFLKKKQVSDTGLALHLRSFVSNYEDKCNLDEGRPD